LKKIDSKLLKFFIKNELNVYNIWFQEVEKKFGLDDALKTSHEVWKKLGKIDGKKISNIFGPAKDLDGLLKLIDIASYFALMEIEIENIDEKSAFINVISCYWRDSLSKNPKLKKESINCNEIGISALSSFIESINPNYEIILDQAIPLGNESCRLLVRKKNK
jgi:hypothetical protein